MYLYEFREKVDSFQLKCIVIIGFWYLLYYDDFFVLESFMWFLYLFFFDIFIYEYFVLSDREIYSIERVLFVCFFLFVEILQRF